MSFAANAISENSAEGEHLIKKRLGGRYFRRPWSHKDWFKRNGGDFYNDNFDSDMAAEKRGGARFVNFLGDFDQSPYQIQKRPGARFMGGTGYGYYGSYAKRPGRRYYRSVDEMERMKKPGARFLSYGPRMGKRYDSEEDENSYEERIKRSRSYGYPSWLRSRAG